VLLLDNVLLLQSRVSVADAIPHPLRPLLASWYRVVEDGRRYVFEHGHRAVVLEGGAVRELLPRLLPLLDGTRSVDELARALGEAARPAIVNAVVILAERGLVIEGPPAAGEPELVATAEAIAADTGSAPARIAERLARAEVAVAGSGPVAGELARLLARSGIGSVGWSELGGGLGPADLVVAAPAADELDAMPAVNAAALASGQPWLQVLPFDGRFLAVGPLVLPGSTACARCYQLRRTASLGFGELGALLDRRPPHAPAGPILEVFGAAAAAVVVVRWVGSLDPRLPGTLFALEPGAGPRISVHAVLRVPRCDACSGLAALAAPRVWFDPDCVAESA
jgi:bacteriocin biosynthesis cyclodehydratase domain-containing protein